MQKYLDKAVYKKIEISFLVRIMKIISKKEILYVNINERADKRILG